MSTKPDAWTLSPQLTEAPELWRNAQLVVPLWEGSGPPVDIVTGNNASIVGLPAWNASRSGRTIKGTQSGTSERIIFPSLRQSSNSNPYTIAVFFNRSTAGFTSVSGGDEALISIDDDFLFFEDSRAHLYMEDGDGTLKFINQIGQGASAAIEGTTTGLNDGKNHVCVVVSDGVDSANNKMWLDGKEEPITVSGSEDPTIGTTHPILLLNGSAQSENRASLANIYLAVLIFEKWTPVQVKKFSGDPFAMLRPAGF